MLTPQGKPADSWDQIMLLSTWRDEIARQSPDPDGVISAFMGRPRYPLHTKTTQRGLEYWSKQHQKASSTRELLIKLGSNDTAQSRQAREAIVERDAVINYGDPSGEESSRNRVAKAFSKWYSTDISKEDILPTVGGAGALHHIFTVLNKMHPKGCIVTPYPHYSLYGQANLFPVNIMDEPGYRLSAAALEDAILKSQKSNNPPCAVLLCDPMNPLGTSLNRTETKEIAVVLRKYPDLKIILDEAYAEMYFGKEGHPSLLKVAPDLKDRIIIMRSATKAHSAAGERMAVLIAFDKALMSLLTENSIATYGHAPLSSQEIYAAALDSLDEEELTNLKAFYEPQVRQVFEGLKRIGANLPDPNYRIDGTFYVVADLSDLIGTPLSEKAERALGKKGNIHSDVDICYHMAFEDNLIVAPMSCFGIEGKKGLARITCSEGDTVLNDLLVRLEKRLTKARISKNHQLVTSINTLLANEVSALPRTEESSENSANAFTSQLAKLQKNLTDTSEDTEAFKLKEINNGLQALRRNIIQFIKRNSAPADQQKKSATTIQAAWRGYKGRQIAKDMNATRENKIWEHFIGKNFKLPAPSDATDEKKDFGQKLGELIKIASPLQRQIFTSWGPFYRKHVCQNLDRKGHTHIYKTKP